MISWHAIGAYAQFPGARNAKHTQGLSYTAIQGHHHACLFVAHHCNLVVVQCNCTFTCRHRLMMPSTNWIYF
uniref:Uncharacterized protein n=1 Tax=Aegilops tauschii subsp. strangulata TaxID=200361 RepID=A0A453G6H2_AEGTS